MRDSIRILDKSTYPRKTLDTYEMIAAYYIDMFYNHLYFEAKKLRNEKSVPNITEGYRHTLTAFLQGIETPGLYKKSLLGLHTFFLENGYTNMTFSQCIERVVKEFIPGDYYDSLIGQQKNSILRSTLNSVCKSFILKLVDNYLIMVIDQHNEPDNARILQDEFIDLLLLERESMYKRFLTGKAKNTKTGNLQHSMIESMQKEIKTLVAEKYDFKKQIRDLKKIILLNNKRNIDANTKIEHLTNSINELQNEIKQSQVPRPAEVPPIEEHFDIVPLGETPQSDDMSMFEEIEQPLRAGEYLEKSLIEVVEAAPHASNTAAALVAANPEIIDMFKFDDDNADDANIW